MRPNYSKTLLRLTGGLIVMMPCLFFLSYYSHPAHLHTPHGNFKTTEERLQETQPIVDSHIEKPIDCEAASYQNVYQMSRDFFNYESPLPSWPPPHNSKERFRRTQLFDWKVMQQVQLWRQFVEAEYVTKSLQNLLQDSLGMFPDLDRVFLYCFVQHVRPSRFFEIGSGESTEVVRQALRVGEIKSQHLTIEPYRTDQVPSGVEVIQQEVQELNIEFFDKLSKDDVLFIDSSHVTMPYGDTLTELLTILPRLESGVFVHIHDIFLPYDYPENWGNKNYVYTEQWLVALMLYGADKEWEVIWGSRLMMMDESAEILTMPAYPLREGQTQPNGGSLWIRKLGAPLRN